ncbi:MAG TPA: molybdopterin molybdenumtransferase MoeA [Candidatus Atribacteria bacterium]|nr:molybdopterin molybdenumtransferase MoeA [Candidatus Atribacteria bacterium]
MAKPLFKVRTPQEVIKELKDHLNLRDILKNNIEDTNIKDSLGKVLAEEIVSPCNLPGFIRSTMDGYALRAEDSFGASESLPSYLRLIGEIKMGSKSELKINPGEAVKIFTGGMLPEGANAVIMWEYTSEIDDTTIELRKSVAPGENIAREDEDLKAGEVLLKEGHKLRPQDIGVLAGIGKVKVKVSKKPRVAIISTGNEVVPPQDVPQVGEIRDINSYTLGACVKKANGIPIYGGIVKDEANFLEQEIREFIEKDRVEAVVISGGSSMGSRDITLEVLSKLGKPGVLIHGVSVKPGKPTIIAIADNRPLFGLPGHPVSAMIIFDLFVRPLISWLQGEDYNNVFSPKIEAELISNVASDPGREDYIRVVLYEENGKFYAKPILGKSGLISTMVRASGLVKIGLNVEGLKKGSKVMVRLF